LPAAVSSAAFIIKPFASVQRRAAANLVLDISGGNSGLR